jgi:hypothetical protein
MFERLRRQTSTVHTLEGVLQILLSAREPAVVLQVFGDNVSGELWLRNGTKIVGARAKTASGVDALLQLLEVRNPSFEVVRAVDDAPGDSTNVDVLELLSGRQKVIESLKLVQWRQGASRSGLKAFIAGAGDASQNNSSGDSAAPEIQDADSAAQPIAKKHSKYKLSGEDDLAYTRRAELESAKRETQGAPITSELAQQHAEFLSPKVDQMSLRREADLEAAAKGEVVFPPLKSQPVEPPIRSPESQVSSRRSTTSQRPEDTELLLPMREVYTNLEQARTNVSTQAKDFLRQSDGKGSLRDQLKVGFDKAVALFRFQEFEGGDEARRKVVISQFSKWVFLAIGLSVLSLPLIGVLGFQRLDLDRQINSEDAPSLAAEVNSFLDEPYRGREKTGQHYDILAAERELAENEQAKEAAAPVWKQALDRMPFAKVQLHPLKLPDLHNPFRPPDAKPSGAGVGSPSQPPAATDSTDVTTQEDVEKALGWHPPAHGVAPLSPTVRAQALQQMSVADKLLADGRENDAFNMYQTLLAQFPGDAELRVAAINLCMRRKNLATARVWCAEGMRNATTYGDYLCFNSMLQNLQKRSPQEKPRRRP